MIGRELPGNAPPENPEGENMQGIQVWLMLQVPHFTGSGRSLTLAIVAGVVLMLSLAVLLERQRPSRRVFRARRPETIPTWGDLYLDSLAEAHRRPRRSSRGPLSTP